MNIEKETSGTEAYKAVSQGVDLDNCCFGMRDLLLKSSLGAMPRRKPNSKIRYYSTLP